MISHPRTMTVALFPGPGSRSADMGAGVARQRPDLHRAVTAMCGGDPFTRLDRGGRFLQPATFCASVTAWDRLRDTAGRPPAISAAAGHSVGELAALTAAGALDELDGLWLAVLRGRLFDEAFARVDDPGAPLAVAEGLATALSQIEIRPTTVPVYSCASAAPFTDVRRELAEAIVRPVRFADLLRALVADGATDFLEPGPGRAPTGRGRRLTRPMEIPRAGAHRQTAA